MLTSERVSFSDEDLVLQAQNGDQPAFAELIRRHRGGCLKLALSIRRDRHDAEDDVQDALWKAFQHINQFQRDARFSTWLTRIVVNQCLMKIRRDRRAKFLYLDDAQIGEDTGTLDLPGHDDSPEQQLGKKQVASVISLEVGRIPPLLRNVFMLREVQRLPMAEVAGRLGISVPAAKSRLLRARMELRNRLDRHQGRLGPATLLAS